MEENAFVLMGKLDYAEAKRLQAALAEQGVEIRLKSDPASCGSCKPQLDVQARPTDLPTIQAFIAEERKKSMGDLQYDTALASEVFDPEQSHARCPACGTEFSTTLTGCPDCGLCFAAG